MLLLIPSIVVNAVLMALTFYAMWTRGTDLALPTAATTVTTLPSRGREELAAA